MHIVYELNGVFHEIVLPESVRRVTVGFPKTDDMPALDVHVFREKVELDEFVETISVDSSNCVSWLLAREKVPCMKFSAESWCLTRDVGNKQVEIDT